MVTLPHQRALSVDEKNPRPHLRPSLLLLFSSKHSKAKAKSEYVFALVLVFVLVPAALQVTIFAFFAFLSVSSAL